MARQRTVAALAASEIRKTLKKNGINARVRSKTYSMGSSCTVELTDAMPATVKAIDEALDKYEYGTFDAMTDCQGIKNSDFDGPQVKYLFVSNDMSDEAREEIRQRLSATMHGFDDMQDYEQERDIYRVFSGQDDHVGFWASRKARVRVA